MQGVFMVTPSERQGNPPASSSGRPTARTLESARWVAEVAEAIQHAGEARHSSPGRELPARSCSVRRTSNPHETCWPVRPPGETALSRDLRNPACMATRVDCRPGRTCGLRRSVIYSLGIVLYELLDRRSAPSQGAARRDLAERTSPTRPARHGSVRRSIPMDLEAICLKAMARKPEDRYATPGDLAQALRQFLSGQTDRKKSFWKRK